MRIRFSHLAVAVALLLLMLPLVSCSGSGDPAEERARRAREGKGPILIGAAWPWEIESISLFGQGLEMAVDEINASGGVLGRELKVIRGDDQQSVSEARLVAQRLANNPDVVAVIGHYQSGPTIAAAAIYDEAGVLHLAPTATNPELTQRDYPMLFTLNNNDELVGRNLADYAAKQGYERVAVCYMDNEFGRTTANAFEGQARARGIAVVDRRAYDPNMEGSPENIQSIVSHWKEQPIDALFLAGELPVSARIIAEARALGISAPVVGTDALSGRELIDVGGQAAEGTVLSYRYDSASDAPGVRDFVTSFKARYGVVPPGVAAVAYDAVHMLAHAFERAGSAAPSDVAEAIHSFEAWPGVISEYTFDENGALHMRVLKLKTVRNGRFVPLDTFELTE